MKKLVVLWIVAAVLIACQPIPDSTPISIEESKPTLAPPMPIPELAETLAVKKSQIQGIWYNFDANVFVEITGDGGFFVYKGLDYMVVGTRFAFEDQKMILSSDDTCNSPATYEFYVLKRSGKLVGMRLQLAGDDTCPDRKGLLDGRVFQCVSNIPASCNTP